MKNNTNNDVSKAKQKFIEGINFFENKDYESAEIRFLESLKLTPGRLSIVGNIIKVYVVTKQSKKLEKLLEDYDSETNKDITFGKAFNCYYKDNYKQSINLCNDLIKYEDLRYPIQDLLALNYKKLYQFIDALKIYKKKLSYIKDDFKIYFNIASLFFELGKYNKALIYFEKSKELNIDNADINWRISLCKLSLQDFKKGFELYENRWKRQNNPKKKFSEIKFPKKISDIKDKKILIWEEQGLGDTLQFSRFVVDLKKFTKNITFVVNQKLFPILQNLSSNINIKNYDQINMIDFDYQIPICSLPKFLNISKKEEIKFYKLEINNDENLEKKAISSNLKVGIAWAGNPNYPMDKYRSIPFKTFSTILKVKNVEFYNLSNNHDENINSAVKNYEHFFDLGKKTFYEIAQSMKNLDIVVSVDTSIIHLAGLLDVKSILLLNHNADWRWFNDDKKTIWYPSVQIIKQTKFNYWGDVFEKLISIIEKKKASKNSPF